MKIKEVLSEKQLDEINLRQLAVAGAVLGAAAFGPHPVNHPNMINPNIKIVKVSAQPRNDVMVQTSPKPLDDMVQTITQKYNVDPSVAEQIVQVAKECSDPVFPKTKDILAVIGIESSFNHLAKSKLHHDPAVGLMQTRAGIWKIPPKELSNIKGQIEHGVKILKYYYQKLGSVEGALRAYNLGLTRYLKHPDGPRGARYVKKFHQEKQMYASL